MNEASVRTETDGSLERLQKKLDKDFTWRKKELTIAKSNIDGSSGEELDFNLKVATTTLYSHWEGFIKNSSLLYLKYLNKKKYILARLKNNFKILHYTKNILDIEGSRKKSKYIELYEAFSKENEDIFCVNLNSNHIINTYGNLKFENLKEILFSLNIDVTDFQMKDNLIDINLLSVRNKIAHGEYHSYVNHSTTSENSNRVKDEFFQLYDDILSLMELFKDRIIEAALEESYLAD
ncbi:MAE_28990/MAE_18760 family HEPN-like nuclease [Kurthia sp. ISK08]|uniref:MAE_28990/MAE_18760 family HEPN-like nuclease n=1 Tax=Kurthia sp. ISK08 TaxID=3385835 RepID=UPI0038FC6DF4